MCRLRNIALPVWQTDRQTDGRTDGETDGRMDRQTTDKVIPMCRYASQATQKSGERCTPYHYRVRYCSHIQRWCCSHIQRWHQGYHISSPDTDSFGLAKKLIQHQGLDSYIVWNKRGSLNIKVRMMVTLKLRKDMDRTTTFPPTITVATKLFS